VMVFLIKNEETIVQTIITSTQTKTHFLTDQTKKKSFFATKANTNNNHHDLVHF